MKNSAYYIKNVKIGRGYFNLPPVLIGTMFYDGQTLVEKENPKSFNKQKAIKRIETHKKLASQYKIPEMVEISASNVNAMVKYLDFFLDNYETPFVLGGTLETRIAGIQYLEERGIKPAEYIYNAISNLKNKKELDIIKKYNIESVVILMLCSENMTSTQRYAYLTERNQPGNVSLLQGLKDLGVEKILVDGGVINLESLAHILETQKLVSESLHLPVGTAPNLFLFKYSSPRLNKKFHTKFRRASIMFVATWFSNFIFYGAIEDATESFASAYQSFQFKKIVREKNLKLFD
jgi:tetrahydromethanopterin S-methyltransferase subunit H